MNTDMQKFADKEARKAMQHEKKCKRVGKTAAWGLGIGVGLLFATMMAPVIIGDAEAETRNAFFMLSWALIGYGVVLLASLGFANRHIGKVNLALTYVVMPAIILKVFMDVT